MRTIAIDAVAGASGATWDGRDGNGRRVLPGVFLYRVALGSRSAAGKILHVR